MIAYDPSDEPNEAMRASRQAHRDQLSQRRKYPMVGDVLLMLDGTTRRAAHVHDYTTDVTVQPSHATIGAPSLHWREYGTMEYSGALDTPIPVAKFERAGTQSAPAWVFSRGVVRAHNGVTLSATVTEWKEQP